MSRFARGARLRTARDYSAAFQNGARLREPLFDFVISKGATSRPRLGLAVSRKVLPLATERNRLKRQIRESFRRQALPLADVVVIPRSAAARADNATLRRELSQLWSRARERCRES